MDQITEQLYVRHGEQRFPVASFEEASRKWNIFRDATGAGASQLHDAIIENSAGKKVARISYNGRVWGISENDLPWEYTKTLLCESVY